MAENKMVCWWWRAVVGVYCTRWELGVWMLGCQSWSVFLRSLSLSVALCHSLSQVPDHTDSMPAWICVRATTSGRELEREPMRPAKAQSSMVTLLVWHHDFAEQPLAALSLSTRRDVSGDITR